MQWWLLANVTAVAFAAGAFGSDGAECADDKVAQLGRDQVIGPNSDYNDKCAMIHENKFYMDAVPWANETSLTGVAGCKAPTCLDSLRKMVAALPDCEYSRVNLKRGYTIVLQMCEKF